MEFFGFEFLFMRTDTKVVAHTFVVSARFRVAPSVVIAATTSHPKPWFCLDAKVCF